MRHIATKDEHLWIHSMGKRFRVRCITDNVDEANDFMKRHGEAALIACFGDFNIIANQYEGIRDSDERTEMEGMSQESLDALKLTSQVRKEGR